MKLEEKLYRYRWVGRPVLCYHTFSELSKAWKMGLREVSISLDLGFSQEYIRLSEKGVEIRGELIGWSEFEIISKKPRDIFFIKSGRIFSASISREHFYKLVSVKWGKPPTLEIDGIHMHRVKDVTPDIDTKMKISLLGSLKCCRVLDTCTGLGYTAIEALKRGACSIVSFEIDLNVLELSCLNPWSRELENDKIKIYNVDVREGLEEYGEEYFDAVIHDPPRISLAGELYSLEFYKKLFKVLRRGGRIVHYVGQPGIHSGKKIWRGVLERMRQAGFNVRHDPRSRCVYGVKKTV